MIHIDPARQSIRYLLVSCTLLLCCIPFAASNADEAAYRTLPLTQPTPGGVVILNLGKPDSAKPKAQFNDIPVAVLETNAGWHAVVGIPLSTKPGQHQLDIVHDDGSTEAKTFQIETKSYPEQHLTIKNKRKVNPNEEDMLRIRQDRTDIANAKRYRHPVVLSTRLDLPVEGIRSSSFGSRRILNGQPRRPHGGMDIAAATGTPIFAPADAYVIETGDYFFSGKCLFLGHGEGLQTFYAHLSKIHVEPGEQVKRGQLVAEVGATGRVTGAHLHWSVGLNRTWVDPELFLVDAK
ncbi:hypothetical protein AB833_20340 [Chromatiales bacterium (ex Bugula neritina AB1)]|nr:hypothetical protein AB833_20340 [Chromatiales bacterium (ex Bugula neritina AB1)]